VEPIKFQCYCWLFLIIGKQREHIPVPKLISSRLTNKKRSRENFQKWKGIVEINLTGIGKETFDRESFEYDE